MKLWLAPLDGITNYVYRNCLCRHFGGIDFFMTPFLPVQERAKLNVANWRDIWPKNNVLKPTVPQLMGNNPPHFVDTMNLLHEAYGYTSYNWNIGCPVAQVVRRHRGCGVMPDTDRVEEVVRTVTEQTPYKFSVKMRLGLHSPEEGLKILDRLEKYPLEFVVVHPRLGKQLYEEIKNGYTNKMSFGFTVTEDEELMRHEENKDVYIRTITKIGRLYDVSAVSLPANDGTEISARSLVDGVIAKRNQELNEAEKQKAVVFAIIGQLLKNKKNKNRKSSQNRS